MQQRLPRLHHQPDIDPEVLRFLQELKSVGFSGDIETSYSSRLAVATDNSVYQQLPQAVVLPGSTEDVALIGRVSSKPGFEQVTFSPRGGGTGTNGQALTKGVVVDFSRHMNRILEVNAEERWVRVESGVIRDQLNDAVRRYGLFFSPNLSTSNRATLGGMINTDASGQGSLKYGKTSDHVLALQAVFADGSVWDSGDSGNEAEPASVVDALRITEQVCRENRALIVEKFPDLNRFLTGYDLKNAIDEESDGFNPVRVLCGSEGTLAFITEATLRLTPIPKARTLVNIKYSSFDAALRSAPAMVEAKALSVETIDSTVLDLAKQDIVWNNVKGLLEDTVETDLKGLNIVEFAGDSPEEVEKQVAELSGALDAMIADNEPGILGYQVCTDLDSINGIYGMRKKAVGLLGATKGRAKPVAFTEDTCVPPERLADFISEFRELLISRKLAFGMFGHVDSGVLHVRPALDLCDPEQERLMQEISDQVVQLVAKYGGLMWGEHGKGYRSEYGPEFFGKELFAELRRLKAAFDPLNKMNPGKICTPLGTDFELVRVSDTKRAYFDRQIDEEVRTSFKQAVECNGNGLCFNYDAGSPMCPSMKVTADRRHSPKGRAGLVREWLRQLSEQGVDILDLEKQAFDRSPCLKDSIDRLRNTAGRNKKYDFSHEVYEAMNGCLACKACASQCPVKVDVASFRSRFLHIYHTRYQRPVKDYLVANIEKMLPLMAVMPRVVNGIISRKWVARVTEHTVGYVNTPLLSVPALPDRARDKQLIPYDFHVLSSLPENERQDHVIVIQDPFTSYYEADVVDDFLSLLIALGKKPVLLPFKPNGKAQHIKGFLKQFGATARSTAQFLSGVARLDMPMVGVDPALVLCYRDEYTELLGSDRGAFDVSMVHEWLLPRLDEFVRREDKNSEPWYLFAHCTEKTELPNAEKDWVAIFAHFGLRLEPVAVGCCGMAGTFGHESDKLRMSREIYELSWRPNFNRLPKDRCLVTGYSCRSQVKRFEGVKPKHPLQVLLECVRIDE